MTDPTSPGFDEVAALKALQKDSQAITKSLEQLLKIKAGSPTAIAQLAEAVQKLPAGEQVARALEEVRARAQALVQEGQAHRREAFRRVEASFINDRRKAGEAVRELNDAWRVGRYELQVRREQAQARLLYNREELVGWSPVPSPAELAAMLEAGDKKLAGQEVAGDELAVVFWDAYQESSKHHGEGGARSIRVPMPEFYRAVRVALVRHELSRTKSPDRKLARAEFPRWAFLYNLDRYRALGQSVPADRRLVLETGSQVDHSKGLGMLVNGLDAAQDYKSYCYVYHPAPGA